MVILAIGNAQALTPGSFIGWGDTSNGKNAPPAVFPPLNDVSAITTNATNTLALRSNGTVVVWGASIDYFNPPQDLRNVVAIAANDLFMMALQANGKIVFWGNYPRAGLFIDAAQLEFSAIAATNYHVVAIKRDGTVLDWNGFTGEANSVPQALVGVKAITAAGESGLALTAEGKVNGWGLSNFYGQNDPPSDLSGVVAIAEAETTGFALTTSGSVIAWGENMVGLKDGASGLTGIKAIVAAGSGLHALALDNNGIVTAWGANDFGVNDVPPGITNVNAIAVSRFNSFALNALPLVAPVPPYAFSGFQSPVNTSPVINIGKAGRTYPVKWQLKNEAGAYVSKLASVKSINTIPTLCGAFSSSPTDLLDTVSAGDTALRYDTSANQFIYNWKTASSPGCHTLFLTLDSGQIFTAYFNLAK